jgi:hypothetical protein
MARNPQSYGLKDECPIVVFMGQIVTDKMWKMTKIGGYVLILLYVFTLVVIIYWCMRELLVFRKEG